MGGGRGEGRWKGVGGKWGRGGRGGGDEGGGAEGDDLLAHRCWTHVRLSVQGTVGTTPILLFWRGGQLGGVCIGLESDRAGSRML